MGGTNIPLPELDVSRPQPAPFPDALQEFQRAAGLQQQAAQTQQTQAQTQGVQQQNQMQAMQLKDEQMRRSLAPQFVQKDENGKVKGFDTDGLYNAMLQNGADPASIAQMRMKQVEFQKSLLGLSDEQLKHQGNVNDVLFDTLESVKSAWKQADPTLGKAQQGAAAPGSSPSAPVPGTGGMPSFMLPNAPQAQGAAPAAVPPEAQAAYQKGLIKLAQNNIPVGNLKPVLTSYDDIDQAEAAMALHKQQLAEQGKQADIAEKTGKGAQGQAAAQKDLADAALTNLKLKGGNMTPTDIHSAVQAVIPQNWSDPTLAARRSEE